MEFLEISQKQENPPFVKVFDLIILMQIFSANWEKLSRYLITLYSFSAAVQKSQISNHIHSPKLIKNFSISHFQLDSGNFSWVQLLSWNLWFVSLFLTFNFHRKPSLHHIMWSALHIIHSEAAESDLWLSLDRFNLLRKALVFIWIRGKLTQMCDINR